MSAEANKNVQIAANHLSLEDLEVARQKASQASQHRHPFSPPGNGNERSARVASRLKSNLDSLTPGKTAAANQQAAVRKDQNPLEELIVVSIPAIGDAKEAARPKEDLGSRLQRLPQSTHFVPFVDKQIQESETETEPGVPEEVLQQPIGELPSSELRLNEQSQARADLSETPEDWLPHRDKGEKRTNKQAKPLEAPKQAFNELTNQVLDDFPLGPSSVLLVADVDGMSSGYAVAYQLAYHLATRKVGKVLVIDSHFEERELSCRLSLGSELGLADILATGKTLEETVCETDLANLDVLPVGTERMCLRKSPESTWIVDNIQSLRDQYQFVIVSVGNVFHQSTAMWAKQCDASYMAIELGGSNRTVAKSGVVRLQQFGARLMGCVVTDAAA